MITLFAITALLSGGDGPEDFQWWKPSCVSIEESIATLKALGFDTQDKSARIRDLVGKAEEESKKGNGAAAERYLAEAWSLRSEVLYEQGNRGEAENAYAEARKHGWTGAPVWSGKPTPTPTPGPKPVQPKTDRPQDRPVPVPQPTPRRKPRTGEFNPWPNYEMNPLKTSRNGGFNSLLGIPPMEEAIGIPEESWDARLWIEVQGTDWSEDGTGGTNIYAADLHEESFEFNYGLTNNWLLGARLTMGELMQNGSDPIRIFENGTQIVPSGNRGFAFSELVLRSKYLFETKFANLGVLGEIKIPVANDKAFLTSGTIDIAIAFLLTKRFSEKFAFHLNVGPVIPVGSSGLFEPDEDPSVFVQFGAGATYKFSERLGAMLQVEGNTTPWSDIGLDDFTARVTGGGRYKLGDSIWLQGGAGFGINELSGGLMFSGSIDLTF